VCELIIDQVSFAPIKMYLRRKPEPVNSLYAINQSPEVKLQAWLEGHRMTAEQLEAFTVIKD